MGNWRRGNPTALREVADLVLYRKSLISVISTSDRTTSRGAWSQGSRTRHRVVQSHEGHHLHLQDRCRPYTWREPTGRKCPVRSHFSWGTRRVYFTLDGDRAVDGPTWRASGDAIPSCPEPESVGHRGEWRVIKSWTKGWDSKLRRYWLRHESLISRGSTVSNPNHFTSIRRSILRAPGQPTKFWGLWRGFEWSERGSCIKP